MLDDINARLQRWAEWNRRREDGGLGYPKQAPYTRLQARSGGGYVPDVDGEALETERAVIELRQQAPDLHQIVSVYYRRTVTNSQAAAACGCAVRTFYERLHRAHEAIAQALRHLNKKA